jgi:hypothetical protein
VLRYQNRKVRSLREIRRALEPRFQICCTAPMAEEKEKNRAKDIILWIITVALVALAIFWYQKPR